MRIFIICTVYHKVTESRSRRWAEHVASMGMVGYTCIILVRKSERKTSFGRLRHRFDPYCGHVDYETV
jgi:hypothetical protein